MRGRAMPAAEREGRLKLAAAYRAFVHFGWDELTANHLTLRLPGENPTFLINPYGLMFSEITAGNLVRVDLHGKVLDNSRYPINPAGLNIHTAIHMGRHDARCVMHAHTPEGMAVSCMEEGLMFLCLEATDFYGRIGYHDFEGPAVMEDERPRLQHDLASNSALILRNHGVLTVGETVDEAFLRMYRLLLACRVQVAALATQRPLLQPSAHILELSARRHDRFFRIGPHGKEVPWGSMDFDAVMRLIDRHYPDYRDI
ncbi:MAG: class II aldolase/adducin family protein [Alphaproteobacteria bacterium]|nr:class II aldolase/adducin family protein [Alphaproteobacteria bacterium]